MSRGHSYRNGQWIDAAELSVPIDDLGFEMGVTVVERLRTFSGAPYRTDEHVARLRRSLQIVGWNAEALANEASEAIREFAHRNAAYMAPGDDWAIVAFVTPGKVYDGSEARLCVHGFPLPFAGWARQFREGVRAIVSDVRQTPENCWPPELKCRSRMHYYLADRQAQARDPDARALLLDQRGFVCEASTANVVAYTEGKGVTTPRLSGVLPGISQQTLLRLADALGAPHREADLAPDDLSAADEVMFTSTSICVVPVVQIDQRPIGDGRPGTFYERLLTAWSEEVGVDVAAQARRFAQRPAK